MIAQEWSESATLLHLTTPHDTSHLHSAAVQAIAGLEWPHRSIICITNIFLSSSCSPYPHVEMFWCPSFTRSFLESASVKELCGAWYGSVRTQLSTRSFHPSPAISGSGLWAVIQTHPRAPGTGGAAGLWHAARERVRLGQIGRADGRWRQPSCSSSWAGLCRFRFGIGVIALEPRRAI